MDTYYCYLSSWLYNSCFDVTLCFSRYILEALDKYEQDKNIHILPKLFLVRIYKWVLHKGYVHPFMSNATQFRKLKQFWVCG